MGWGIKEVQDQIHLDSTLDEAHADTKKNFDTDA